MSTGNNFSLSKFTLKTIITAASLATLLMGSGCATNALLEDNQVTTSSSSARAVLSQDQIIAFGRPAVALPQMPMANMVIVGNKNSYVLSQGGTEMTTLLTNLTAKNIKVENDMSFEVPNNDGYFQGQMKMSYVKLKDEFARSDYQFFLQNGGQDCTSASDARINAQRFCFSVPVKGAIYPQVSNLSMIQSQYRALSKPYTVTFYGQTQQTRTTNSGTSTAGKLVLLPFALAFDVVTLPIQILDSVAN